jgi:hypothetical protein
LALTKSRHSCSGGNGEWELCGLFTPPWLPEAGKLPGCAPLPPDRVFLFVRAGTLRKPDPDAPPPGRELNQVTVLAEWIETDTATASGLLAAASGLRRQRSGARGAGNRCIGDGRAALLESAVLPVRSGQRAKIESITEFPYPTEFDPPQAGGAFEQQPPPHRHRHRHRHPLHRPKPLPGTPASFTFRNLGTTMEIEATVGVGGAVIDLNCAPELAFNTVLDSFGQGLAELKQPRFHTLKMTVPCWRSRTLLL